MDEVTFLDSIALQPRLQRETIQGYRLADHDFIVIGNGVGDTIEFGKRRFGGTNGLGFDSRIKSVREDRNRNYAVIESEWSTLLLPEGQFRFALLQRAIQHLQTTEQVRRVLENSAHACRDFLFVRYPSFDSMAYLQSLGLRQFWTHWHGHPLMLRLDQLLALFEETGLRRYFIRRLGPVKGSDDSCILPVSAPIDQGRYDPAKHDPKPAIPFEQPIWREIEFYIPLRPFENDEWRAITDPPAAPPQQQPPPAS